MVPCVHCGTVCTSRFCCGGCEMAWAMVHEAGLDSYYERRDAPAPRPEPLESAWRQVVPREVDGGLEVQLAIDDLRCSSCVWVVENLLQQLDGVVEAQVSYASGRALVVFDGQQVGVPDVAARIAAVGYRPRPLHLARPPSDLLARLGIAAFCTANLMLLSASIYIGWADGMEERFATMFRWGALALATPVVTYASAPFWESAVRGLRHRTIGMDVPIALAIAVLYAHGLSQTLAGADGYLDSLAMLVTLLLAGRVLEARGKRSALDAASAIAGALPMMARRRTPAGAEEVLVEDLRVADVVEVGAGDDLPADGVVVAGTAQLATALVTGESMPVLVQEGSTVVAGAQVVDGALSVEVSRVGSETLAIRMADAVREALDRDVPDGPLDGVASWFVAATIALSAVGAWLGGVQVAVAVLVVACPCALGLSVPLAVASGMGAAARRGVVLSDGASLLALADVEVLALDKTGTVTEGELAVLDASDEVLRLAASVQRVSRHPIARGILRESGERGLLVPVATLVAEQVGVGVSGVVEGELVEVSGSGVAGEVRVRRSGELVGLIRLGDRVRDDARESVRMAQAAGLRVVLLSGDADIEVKRVAEELGVREWHGSMVPEEKSAWVQEHQRVLFVGDGLNDAAALANADVGIAMRSASAGTLAAASAVVSESALRPVVAAVAAGRAASAAVRSNVRRSVAYNIVAVAAALAGLINPLIAALLMPLSSGVVIWGSSRIERRMQKLEKQWTS